MRPADITPDHIVAIIRRCGPGTVFDIAGELGVNHTAYTLRSTLAGLAGTGQVAVHDTSDAKVFSLPDAKVSDECAKGLCGNCWDDICGCPMCGHSGA